MLCKNITVAKSKEVKTGWSNSRQIWQNLLRKIMAQKRCFANDDDDGDDDNDGDDDDDDTFLISSMATHIILLSSSSRSCTRTFSPSLHSMTLPENALRHWMSHPVAHSSNHVLGAHTAAGQDYYL
jgi:hypothetical protein